MSKRLERSSTVASVMISAYVLPPAESSGLKYPLNIVECVLDLLLPVILVEVSSVVPATLARKLRDVADDHCLRIVAEIAAFLAGALLVDVFEGGHDNDGCCRCLGFSKSQKCTADVDR